MKSRTRTTKSALSLALVFGLIVTAAGFLSPAEAQAAVRVQASINVAPVHATIVVGDGPRLCSIPRPYERRTVVVRDCDYGRDHRDHRERAMHKNKHRRHGQHRQVWVPGYWERISPRTAQWIPGHWERN